MATKFTLLSDKLTERVRKDLEMRVRQNLQKGMTDMVEAAIKAALDKTVLTLDGETLEIDVNFKD